MRTSVVPEFFRILVRENVTPYRAFSDIPFRNLSFTYFHNETFEDNQLNTPGLSSALPDVPFNSSSRVITGAGSIVDSVDGDDGSFDGSGLNGHSFFTNSAIRGFRFEFDPLTLGDRPTHVGLVWTDGTRGRSLITLKAFDASDLLIDTIEANTALTGGIFSDDSNNGTTAEDRFFGFIHASGISAITINQVGGGLEVDHVQYGRLSTPNTVVPEPTSLAVFCVMGLLAARFRRRRGG